MSLRVIVVSVVWSALILAGCAYGEVRQVVRAQFASELDCPEVTIKKRDAWYGYDSHNQFKVSGCGVMRTYTCPVTEGRVSYDEPPCTFEEGDADAPEMAAPKPQDPALDGAPMDPMDEPMDDAEPEDPFEDDADDADSDDDEASKASGRASASGGFRIGGKKK